MFLFWFFFLRDYGVRAVNNSLLVIEVITNSSYFCSLFSLITIGDLGNCLKCLPFLKIIAGFVTQVFLLSGKHSVIWITLADWHGRGH